MRTRNTFTCLLLGALACGRGGAQPSAPPPVTPAQLDARLGTQPVAPPPGPLTLPDAVRVALANHNQIAIAESQRMAAESRLTQSKSAYYPRITPFYQFSHQRFGQGRDLRGGSDTRNSTGIDLTQTIYDSGRREVNVARSEDSVRAAGFNTRMPGRRSS